MRNALAVLGAMVAVFAAVVVVRLALAPKRFDPSFELRTEHELGLDEAETQVAIPLERALFGLEGVAAVHTHVDTREVTLKVELKPGAPFDAVVFPAIQKVSEVETRATPPSLVSTREPTQTTYLSFASEQLPMSAVDELVENQVRLDLLRVPGYRDVEVCGQAPAVVITLDPVMAAGAGLEPIDVLRKLELARSTAGARVAEGQGAFVVRGLGSTSVEDLKTLSLGNNVRLTDVARISEEPGGPRCVGFSRGRVVGAVVRHLADADFKALSRSLASLPAAVSSHTLRVDRTLTISGAGLDSKLAGDVDRMIRMRPDVQDVAVEVTARGQVLIAKAYVELKDPRGPTLLTTQLEASLLRIDGEDLRELSVSGPELESLEATAKDVEEHLGRLGGYTSTRPPRNGVKHLSLDREVLARMNLAASDVTDVLRLTGDEGVVVSTEYTQTSRRDVHLKLPKLEPENLALIRVGKGVPLAAVARLTTASEPAWIDRDDGQRVIRFQTTATAAQLTEALKDLRLPGGVTLRR